MLCSFCAELVQLDPANSWQFYHHSTYSALRESASNDCQLCNFLKQILLIESSNDLDLSIEEAERYHLAVDAAEKHEERRPSATFIVETFRVKVDGRFAPYDRGSRGFVFQRNLVDSKLAYSEPWKSVTPFIERIVPFISFVVPKGSRAASHGRLLGAPLPLEADLATGKQWIAECKSKHPLCVSNEETSLPARILDIGPANGSQEPRLRITEGEVGQYATLSHRWGQSKPPSLTQSNCLSYQQSIPFKLLPKTFRDAISAVHQLGYQYLWIDSLCILQDSPDDWAIECTRMPRIYRNAQVNIAADSAVDCTTGFLNQRPTPLFDPLDLIWQIGQGQTPEAVRLEYIGPEGWVRPSPERNSVLATRAWVLQERLLSRRNLHFGKRKLYWECHTTVCYEDIHYPIIDKYRYREEVVKIPFNVPQSRDYWLQKWYEIVCTYSSMEMSYESDKLPALSVLVSEFARLLQDKYVAGLWERDLPRGLTWHIDPYLVDKLDVKDSGFYVAPSWSWASCWESLVFVDEHFYYGFQPDIEVLDVSIQLKTTDVFGQLQNSLVKIRGKSFKAGITWQAHELDLSRNGWYTYSETKGQRVGEYFPDSPIHQSESPNLKDPDVLPQVETGGSELQFLYLGHLSQCLFWAAIAIEEHPDNPSVYYRKGFLKGSCLSPYETSREDVLQSASLETLQLSNFDAYSTGF